VRFSIHRTGAVDCLGWRPHPLVELALPIEYHPATPSRPPQRSAPLMGFCSLQHIKDPRSTSHGRKPARYVPPSGFGYPLGGLLPRIPCRFCFTPAALMGFTLRRFPLSRGSAGLSTGSEPTYRCTRQYFCRPKAPDRPDGTRFLGSYLPRVPCDQRGVLIRRPLAPPMGFAPPGSAAKTLTRTSPDLLSSASRVLAIAHRTRRRFRVSIGPRSASPDPHRSANRPRQPSWGSCTCLFLSIRGRQRPGY
jgi:hypothetical protein